MIQPRIPEGGAIIDAPEMTMTEYSQYMFKMRAKEYQNYARTLLKRANLPQNAQLLEIGSGPGWITMFMIQERPDLQITTLEPSEDMINAMMKEVARKNFSQQIHPVQGYVEKIYEVIDSKFDLVYSNDSLHHWESPEQGLQEIADCLKENGKIYIHDSRRDLSIVGKIILNGFGKWFAGKMYPWWKSSVSCIL